MLCTVWSHEDLWILCTYLGLAFLKHYSWLCGKILFLKISTIYYLKSIRFFMKHPNVLFCWLQVLMSPNLDDLKIFLPKMKEKKNVSHTQFCKYTLQYYIHYENKVLKLMHRKLKLDGAIGHFAEPLWRLKTGHFTT